jgi:hypothetical protein
MGTGHREQNGRGAGGPRQHLGQAQVVRGCLKHAEAEGSPVPRDLIGEGDWRRRYSDREHERDAEARRSRAVRHCLAGRRSTSATASLGSWHSLVTKECLPLRVPADPVRPRQTVTVP